MTASNISEIVAVLFVRFLTSQVVVSSNLKADVKTSNPFKDIDALKYGLFNTSFENIEVLLARFQQ